MIVKMIIFWKAGMKTRYQECDELYISENEKGLSCECCLKGIEYIHKFEKRTKNQRVATNPDKSVSIDSTPDDHEIPLVTIYVMENGKTIDKVYVNRGAIGPQKNDVSRETLTFSRKGVREVYKKKCAGRMADTKGVSKDGKECFGLYTVLDKLGPCSELDCDLRERCEKNQEERLSRGRTDIPVTPPVNTEQKTE